jgi:ketosteroid isomerase-like protein
MAMTGWRIGLALLACAAQPAGAQSNAKPRLVRDSAALVSRQLIDLENDWARALVRRDTAMFRRHLAPKFVYTENAEVSGKEDVIKGVVGSDTVTWAGNQDMQVHLYGNTGVVTGILAMKGRGSKGPFNKRYRFTDTWMLLGGTWQIIAAQDYLMPR